MNRRTFLRRAAAAIAVAAIPPLLHKLPDEQRTEPGLLFEVRLLLDKTATTNIATVEIDGVGFVGVRLPKDHAWHHVQVYASSAVVRSYVDGVRVRPLISNRAPDAGPPPLAFEGRLRWALWMPSGYVDDLYVAESIS